MSEVILETKKLVAGFGDLDAVKGIDLRFEKNSVTAIIGPSGCGKSTYIRCLNRLHEEVPGAYSSGEVLLNGENIQGLRVDPVAIRRRIGMVFQEYALFPHLTVAANVAFGIAGLAGSQRRQRVDELLETVGLAGQGQRYPHELSGGQQQRVALARALAPRPRLILLDEPFSNLDVGLREHLSLEVREILRREATTAVLVTHDQHEAFAMADEVGVMAEGRIEQWDSPYRVYHQPANRFVADFVGQGVFLPGVVVDQNRVRVELGLLESCLPLECSQGCASCGKGCGVEVLLRPDDVIHDDQAGLLAEVRHKAFRGAEILYSLRLASGVEVLSLVPSHHNHAIGERIGIRLDVDHVVAFKTPSRQQVGGSQPISFQR